jgi:glycosyltransferase involved in cell wall biosynthesis
MEAMACGLPTILSRVPGATDLLQNEELSGGLLIPIGDVSALAQGLETLLFDDMLRMRMAKVARSHALDVAATDSVGRQLVDFFSNGKK